ncbi:hypothetical protein SAMN05518672_101910 [Chitinophaga sp. CF118]|uniref:hypothetical protein n=1 Tax=Chitinophaga sp. CF118 TaxID=1884367 RepID=UPI0008EEA550|nr:hypothetical protein [Chitinophaga sp. CF118]SFD18035.1 hypothetical protein SAMN05518672_101910 [Chitinophaga sp. CF118]
MKALLSFALVCTFFSMSSFTVVNHRTHKVLKAPLTISSWPLTGDVQTSQGIMTYSISGSGQIPSSITFYNSSNVSVGSYGFTATGNSVYLATGMKASLNISGVQLGIYTNQAGYTLDFYSPY